MNTSVIHTDLAPQAVGTYSQAVRASNIVRLGLFLTDMSNFARFNQIMGEYSAEPYPARAAVQVVGLPKGGVVEAEATMVCPAD